MTKDSDRGAFWKGLAGALAGIGTFLAIFTFATSLDSLSAVVDAITGQFRPPRVHNRPTQVSVRDRDFHALVQVDIEQGPAVVFGIREKALFRKAQLLKLECQPNWECNGVVVMDIPEESGQYDFAAYDPDTALLALLDRHGRGVTIDTTHWVSEPFQFDLNCMGSTSYNGEGTEPGGSYSVRGAHFRARRLHLVLNAIGCAGEANIGSSQISSGEYPQESVSQEIDLYLTFNLSQRLQSGRIRVERVSSSSLPAEWFRYQSTRGYTVRSGAADEREAMLLRNRSLRQQRAAIIRETIAPYLGVAQVRAFRLSDEFRIMAETGTARDTLVTYTNPLLEECDYSCVYFSTDGIYIQSSESVSALIPYYHVRQIDPKREIMALSYDGVSMSTGFSDRRVVTAMIADVARKATWSRPPS